MRLGSRRELRQQGKLVSGFEWAAETQAVSECVSDKSVVRVQRLTAGRRPVCGVDAGLPYSRPAARSPL